jgi:uncharacterized membrane protein YhhN
MTAFTILIVIASTSALVWAVTTDSTIARWLKMVSSSGFLAVALSAGAASSSYGRIVLVALGLSWLGDLLLTFESRRAFLGGLVAFLLGHVAYSVGFVTLRADPISLVMAALAVAIIGGLVWLWLSPHIGDMKIPVVAYIAVISVMVILAFGTIDGATNWLIPIGATLFFVSDLFVARNRFVAPGIMNRSLGLPLYYTAQVLLALSVAT